MKNKQTYKDWIEDELVGVLGKHFYLSGSNKNAIASELLEVINKYGKPKNTTNELITYEEFSKYFSK